MWTLRVGAGILLIVGGKGPTSRLHTRVGSGRSVGRSDGKMGRSDGKVGRSDGKVTHLPEGRTVGRSDGRTGRLDGRCD